VTVPHIESAFAVTFDQFCRFFSCNSQLLVVSLSAASSSRQTISHAQLGSHFADDPHLYSRRVLLSS